MKIISAFMLLLLLSSCSLHTSKTREEYVTAVTNGQGMTKMHKLVVSKSFNSVVNNLKSKSNSCLAKKVTSTTYSGLMAMSGSSTYKPSMQVKKGKAEFTLQVTYSGDKDYMYALAADIHYKSKNKTALTIYAPTVGYDDVVEAIKTWSNGKNRACPKLM